MTVTSTRTHVYVGFANPFLICEECKNSVPYWHNPERCGCNDRTFNYPCEHFAGVVSKCYTWDPVEGCNCINKEKHDQP